MQPEQDLPDFSAAFELVKPADRAARLSFFRIRYTLCRNGAPMHDMHRRTHGSRWLAGSHYLGRHGIGHYGVGARSALARLRNSARARTTKGRLLRRQTKQDDRTEAG